MKKYILIIFTIIAAGFSVAAADDIPDDSLSYSWRVVQPLGLRERMPLDTLLYNYHKTAVPRPTALHLPPPAIRHRSAKI